MKSEAATRFPAPASKRIPSLNRPDYLPRVLRFFIGGFLGPCHDVTLVGGHLRCRSAVGAYLFGPDSIQRPSRRQWHKFWRAIDAAGVWSWSPEYDAAGICDGTQWALKLSHAGRYLYSEGSNAFPGAPGPDYSRASAFGQFLSALRKLTGLCELR